jgi:hypothetical protein
MGVVGLALRAGASTRIRAATIEAAPPGRGRTGLTLRLTTWADEGGVSEVVALPNLHLVARTNAADAEWSGASNADGKADAWLDLPTVRAGDDVRVNLESDGASLAEGSLKVPSPDPAALRNDDSLPSQRSSGPLTVEVFVYGSKLVPGGETPVAVRVRDAATGIGVEHASVGVDPEPGLKVVRGFPATSAGGWSVGDVALGFVSTAWTLSIRAGDRTATWFGALPVSPGAAIVPGGLAPRLAAGTSATLPLEVPPATARLYVDVVDASGWDDGAVLELARASAGRTGVTLPPLRPGLYWLVTSPDAEGLVSLAGATVARPFYVGPSVQSAEEDLIDLVRARPPAITRGLVLDGFKVPREKAERVRRRTVALAGGSVLIGSLLEALLLWSAARRARATMREMDAAAGELGLEPLEGPGLRRTALFRLLILAFVTLLGFALVAMLVTRSGR